MRYTFFSDERMLITIPVGSFRDAQEGDLMPENFNCVFKDNYKVFLTGQPKAVGIAQIIAGVLIQSLGLVVYRAMFFTIPSILVFVLSGLFTYTSGRSPNMCVMKLSFSLNILSLLWSIMALVLCIYPFIIEEKVNKGILGIIAALLIIELIIALIVIYWESKAVCRQHFNVLPMITIKQEMGNYMTELNN